MYPSRSALPHSPTIRQHLNQAGTASSAYLTQRADTEMEDNADKRASSPSEIDPFSDHDNSDLEEFNGIPNNYDKSRSRKRSFSAVIAPAPQSGLSNSSLGQPTASSSSQNRPMAKLALRHRQGGSLEGTACSHQTRLNLSNMAWRASTSIAFETPPDAKRRFTHVATSSAAAQFVTVPAADALEADTEMAK